MIQIRRLRNDFFDLTIDVGNTKIEEQIGVSELVDIFDAAASALMDDAQRSAREHREQHIRIVQLQKELAEDFTYSGRCTMDMARPVLKLPTTDRMKAAGFTDFKPPNLQEAHRHLLGREFDGAHDAMADVRACRDVFFELERRAKETPINEPLTEGTAA